MTKLNDDRDRVRAVIESLPPGVRGALAFGGYMPAAHLKAQRALGGFRNACEHLGVAREEADRVLDEELQRCTETPGVTFSDALRAARRRLTLGEPPADGRPGTVLTINTSGGKSG